MSANREYRFTRILGWSFSRQYTFDTCKRLYYYRYYTRYVTEHADEVRWLLSISSIPLAVGSVTHEVYEQILRRIQVDAQPIDTDRLRVFVHQKTLDYVQQNPFDTVIKLEKTEAEVMAEVEEKVWSQVETLLGSRIFEILNQIPLDKRKHWLIEPGNHGETRIRGYKVYAIIDFSYETDTERVIVDWKTGYPSEQYRKQLTTYALWMLDYLGEYYQGAVCRLYYTQDIDEPQSFEPSDSDLEQMADEIASNTEEMYNYLEDINKNIPLNIEMFPKIEDKEICKYCSLRSVCYPDWKD